MGWAAITSPPAPPKSIPQMIAQAPARRRPTNGSVWIPVALMLCTFAFGSTNAGEALPKRKLHKVQPAPFLGTPSQQRRFC